MFFSCFSLFISGRYIKDHISIQLQKEAFKIKTTSDQTPDARMVKFLVARRSDMYKDGDDASG